MIEEVARVCASTSVTLLISKLGMIPVINFGSEEMKRRYLPPVASGEAQASYCLSEPDAGSDVAGDEDPGGPRRRRLRAHGHEVLDHQRRHLRHLHRVRQDRSRWRATGASAAFSSRPDGASRSPSSSTRWACAAARPAKSCSTRCACRWRNRIGEEGQGFYIAMHTLDRSRPTIGAQAVGIAQGALDYALGYVQRREQFGKPIAEFQGLQFMLADMAMRIEAARGLVYRACAIVDAGDPIGRAGQDRGDGEVLRLRRRHAGDDRRGPALGGYGYTKDFPVERFMRDAKITQIYEGTNQIQRVVIAKRLLS